MFWVLTGMDRALLSCRIYSTSSYISNGLSIMADFYGGFYTYCIYSHIFYLSPTYTKHYVLARLLNATAAFLNDSTTDTESQTSVPRGLASIRHEYVVDDHP